MMLASQTPPQIKPPLDTVAMLGLLLVKEMSAAIMPPEESKAEAESWLTAPSFREIEVGISWSEVTLLLVELLPPHPGRKTRSRIADKTANTRTAETRRMKPPRQRRPTDVQANYCKLLQRKPKCRS